MFEGTHFIICTRECCSPSGGEDKSRDLGYFSIKKRSV